MASGIQKPAQTITAESDDKPWLSVAVADETARNVFETCNIDTSRSNEALTVLDFGCGMGRYMEVFSRHVPRHNITGVDTDLQALRIARSQGFSCAQLGLDDGCLPFADESFDVVFSSNVIEHIESSTYRKYLHEIHRVMKPGATFAVGAPNYPIKRLYDITISAWKNPATRNYYLFDDPTHINRVSIYRVERDLAEYFEAVDLKPTWLPLQHRFGFLRNARMRRLLRWFGYKFFGSCRKPALSNAQLVSG